MIDINPDRPYLALGPVQMLLLELSSNLPNRFAKEIKRSAIGATFNVMANLAKLDRNFKTAIITALPNDGHGQFICEQIKECGVENSEEFVVMLDDPKFQTSYMCTTVANGLRGHQPLVRRHCDVFANLTFNKAKEYWDFDKLLSKTNILHMCLHELGLNPEISYIYEDLIKSAKNNNVTVIINLNFRKGLYPNPETLERWREYCRKFADLADILIANKEKVLLDLKISDSTSNKVSAIIENYSNLKFLALTGRNAEDGTYAATLYSKENSKIVKIDPLPCKVIYPIGSGDAFDAGLINGLIKKWDLEKTLKFAVNCARDNLGTVGDLLLANEQEILDWQPSFVRT